MCEGSPEANPLKKEQMTLVTSPAEVSPATAKRARRIRRGRVVALPLVPVSSGPLVLALVPGLLR